MSSLVNIIIPNYNGFEHLKTCFESIKPQSYKDYKIILVDNNSTDESVKFTKKTFPDSTVINLDKNYGFAKAVNEGIHLSLAASNCRYILLLNNDIELTPDFIDTAINTFEEIPEASVLAVKMLNFYDRKKIDNCGDFIKKGGSPYARGHNEVDLGQFDKEEFIFGACAGAAIYKKDIFEIVGIFDEDYFAYFEDVDLSFRLQLRGFKCYYNPKAVCYHKRGATTKYNTGYQTMYCEKNLVALRIKNYPAFLLLKWSILFFIARFRRYYRFIRFYSFKLFYMAVKGYIWGLLQIPNSIRKRKAIQKSRNVTVSYIESLFGEGNKNE